LPLSSNIQALFIFALNIYAICFARFVPKPKNSGKGFLKKMRKAAEPLMAKGFLPCAAGLFFYLMDALFCSVALHQWRRELQTCRKMMKATYW
jgi:hypothetical protein